MKQSVNLSASMSFKPSELWAVILCAGEGQRLGVHTLVGPKGVQSIGGKSIVVQYSINACLDAGIRKILIVCSPDQIDVMKSILSPTPEQQKKYMEGKRRHYLGEGLIRVWEEAQIRFVVQDPERDGKGDAFAVAAGYRYIFRKPFLLMFGDAIFDNPDGGPSAVKQVIDCYKQYYAPTVLVQKIAVEKATSFGIAQLEKPEERVSRITGFLEKPNIQTLRTLPGLENGVAVATGVYVITPELLQYLPLAEGTDELRIADILSYALVHAGERHQIMGLDLEGLWFDAGSLEGLEVLRLHFGLRDPEIAPRMLDYLHRNGWHKD